MQKSTHYDVSRLSSFSRSRNKCIIAACFRLLMRAIALQPQASGLTVHTALHYFTPVPTYSSTKVRSRPRRFPNDPSFHVTRSNTNYNTKFNTTRFLLLLLFSHQNDGTQEPKDSQTKDWLLIQICLENVEKMRKESAASEQPHNSVDGIGCISPSRSLLLLLPSRVLNSNQVACCPLSLNPWTWLACTYRTTMVSSPYLVKKDLRS